MATGKDTDRLIPILGSSQQFVVKHWQTAISNRPATEPRSRYLVNPVDDKMRVVGWKILADGSNQGFTDRQREPRVFNLSPIGQSISGTFCACAARPLKRFVSCGNRFPQEESGANDFWANSHKLNPLAPGPP